MRWALLLAVAVVGCGKPKDRDADEPERESPREKAAPSPRGETKATPEPKPEDALPQTTKIRYSGRTAADWGPDLLDIGANGQISMAASNALIDIGGEGLRFTLPALESEYPLIRRRGLEAINPRAAVKHPDVFVPRLVALLDDPAPIVRGYAAITIGRCGFRDAAAALQDRAAKEKDKEVKQQMEGGLKLLQPPK